MSKVKVLFYCSYFPKLSETFILNQLAGMIDAGHEVSISTRKANGLEEAQEKVYRYELLKKVNRIYFNPQHFQMLKNIVGEKLARWFFLKHVTRSIPQYEGIPASPLSCDHDILYGQYGSLGIDLLKLRRVGFLSGKIVAAFRGIDITQHVRKHGREVYRELFDEGALFLPSCHYFKRLLMDLGCPEEKIEVVYSGIDLSLFAKTNSDELKGKKKFRILSVGRLVEKKGFRDAIHSMKFLLNKKPDATIRLDILGEGPLQEDLEKLIQELGLNEVVYLQGRKSSNEVKEWMSKSDLFLAPSITGKEGDQEGDANSPKEAQAMNLPVIATDHGGLKEVVLDQQTGFIVPENEPEQIANQLLLLLNDSELRFRMAKAARQHVETMFDMNVVNRQLSELFVNLRGT